MEVLKLKLYPSTERYGRSENYIEITEKMDGSNLGLFKYDGELYVAQRNLVFKAKDSKELGKAYVGLDEWLEENNFLPELLDGVAIFGEWMQSGRLKYPELARKFYMFAKARVEIYGDTFVLERMNYRAVLRQFAFERETVPNYIGGVTVVDTVQLKPSMEYLDSLYDEYVDFVGRPVEGFIIADETSVEKYIRNTRKGVNPHDPNGHKGKPQGKKKENK